MNKIIKEIKSDIKHIWIYQIETAKNAADNAILENPSDDGTCNFDSALISKEKAFTYDETIAIFAECGIKLSKHKNGYLMVMNTYGNAAKNTRWQKTFANVLQSQGFDTSMYYQMD